MGRVKANRSVGALQNKSIETITVTLHNVSEMFLRCLYKVAATT